MGVGDGVGVGAGVGVGGGLGGVGVVVGHAQLSIISERQTVNIVNVIHLIIKIMLVISWCLVKQSK